MTVQEGAKPQGYAGCCLRDIPDEDPELTHTGPGTPMGEQLRRFWQPVCLSENLTDLPHAIGPNIGEAGTVWEQGKSESYFLRVGNTRWMMPIDDENSVMFGGAHLNERLDPDRNRDEPMIGHNRIDFDAQLARDT